MLGEKYCDYLYIVLNIRLNYNTVYQAELITISYHILNLTLLPLYNMNFNVDAYADAVSLVVRGKFLDVLRNVLLRAFVTLL